MKRPAETHVRALFVVVLLLSGGTIASSYATAAENVAVEYGSDRPAAADIPREDAVTPTDQSGSATETVSDGSGDAGTSTTNGTAANDGTPSGVTVGPGDDTPAETIGLEDELGDGNGTAEVPPGEITVVGTQGFYVSDEQAELVAFSEAGDVLFYEDGYRVYFDVDPVPDERYTVEFLASKHLDGEDCANVSTPRCTYNVYNRVNLTTGEQTEVYGEVTERIYSARWHDVDRVNDTHVVVADILRDSLRLVNTTTDETEWEWHASQHFDRDVGGQEGDWTHINDVEVLDDGRFMASPRNMDQVVFVDPGEGVDANWTLGEEDDHETLYEQHNPDYIPADRGGPAITVADSENGRVLEFQRVDPETGEATTGPDGEWRRSWGWRDSRLQWPRDADRLPNGNTLLVDTHGDRVVEVTPDGSIDWSVTIGMPYDVERLGTGDESSGGESTHAIRGEAESPSTATATDSQTATADETGTATAEAGGDGSMGTVAPAEGAAITHPDRGPVERFWMTMKDLTPSLVVNGILYAGPSWIRFTDLVFGFVFLVTALGWGATELYWSRYSAVGFLQSLPGRVR